MPAFSSIALGVIAAAGAGASIYGNIKANQAQAESAKQNADFYKEQAGFAEDATQRELAIYRDQSENVRGQQVSGFARGGVDLSGSPLLVLASQKASSLKEQAAILQDGQAKVREAYLKAGASMDEADRLSSFEANFLPAAGSVLNTASGFLANTAKRSN